MKSISLLFKYHNIKMYWGSGSIAPCNLNLGTRWRWVVSFTPRPLYPWGKSPWYPFNCRLGGLQSRSGRGGENKKKSHHCLCRELNPGHLARSLATVLTELPRLVSVTYRRKLRMKSFRYRRIYCTAVELVLCGIVMTCVSCVTVQSRQWMPRLNHFPGAH
jgi:hypothetical protein